MATTHVRVRAEFVGLAVPMDVLTRAVRGWERGRALRRGRPEVNHSDQGAQYAATAHVERPAAARRR